MAKTGDGNTIECEVNNGMSIDTLVKIMRGVDYNLATRSKASFLLVEKLINRVYASDNSVDDGE